MLAIDWNRVKKQPVSIGLVFAVAVAILWLHGWLLENFVTKVEAAQYNKQLTDQVAGNTRILNDLTKEFRISAALDRVDSLDAKVYRMEGAGVDPETLRDVKKQLGSAILYCDCLLGNKPNCELLRN